MLGRLDALEHQSAEIFDSLSKLPSHDDWEEYRTMVRCTSWNGRIAAYMHGHLGLERTHAMAAAIFPDDEPVEGDGRAVARREQAR